MASWLDEEIGMWESTGDGPSGPGCFFYLFLIALALFIIALITDGVLGWIGIDFDIFEWFSDFMYNLTT